MRSFTLLALALTAGCIAEDSQGDEPAGPPIEAKPWTEFSSQIVAEGEVAPFTVNPVDPTEAIGEGSPSSLGATQIFRMAPDGSDMECLTCDDDGNQYNLNYQADFTPDGEHIVFVSARDREGEVSTGLLALGGEIYIMRSDGSAQQRLTFFGGFARAPRVSPDGQTLAWTQVTRDNRWRLLFAPLVRSGGAFELGEALELRVLPGPEDPPSATYSRQLAWAEWKHASKVGDWWTVGATYGGRMNVDTYAVSAELGEARRLTSDPENEEFASWDPTGRGLAIMSGRGHRQVTQAYPLPQPSFFDYSQVIFALMAVQAGRIIPSGTDLYYLNANGERAMVRLLEGARDGFLTAPGSWTADGGSFFFGMWRTGLASPVVGENTARLGRVDFSGRPEPLAPIDGRPAFLVAATQELYPVEVVPFDPDDVTPTLDVRIAGAVSGEVVLHVEATLDFAEMRGEASAEFKNFSDGDYTISGTTGGSYHIPANVLQLAYNIDGELDYTNANGVEFRFEEHWAVEDLLTTAEIIFERPANTVHRQLTLDPSVLLGL